MKRSSLIAVAVIAILGLCAVCVLVWLPSGTSPSSGPTPGPTSTSPSGPSGAHVTDSGFKSLAVGAWWVRHGVVVL